jgi:hypothetical protein
MIENIPNNNTKTPPNMMAFDIIPIGILSLLKN